MSFRNPTVTPGTPAASLAIIRIAFLVGVLAFGGVVWVLQNRAGQGPLAPGHPFERIVPYMLAAAFAGVIAVRGAAGRIDDDAKRPSRLIVGWAVGEAAALAGGVSWLLTGDARWYVTGLFVFLLALVLLPVRRP